LSQFENKKCVPNNQIETEIVKNKNIKLVFDFLSDKKISNPTRKTIKELIKGIIVENKFIIIETTI
jgi:hypothetical protein